MEKSKAVLYLGNEKDTVVSFYYHQKLMNAFGYTGGFATYFDLFMDNLVTYSPYFEYVKESLHRRNHPHVRILFYEDMKKYIASSVRKVSKFLGKNVSDEMVEALVDHL